MKYLVLILSVFSLNLKAQNIDSLGKVELYYNHYNHKKLNAYIIPTVFVGYGLVSLGSNAIRDLDLSTKAELSEDHPKFAAHVDDYAIFSPLLAMYALDIAGIKAKNNALDQTAMVLITTAITTATITTLKSKTHRLRPDGSSDNSFPSGHTATVFAAAEMLRQEFKDQSPWLGYAAYAVATATGMLRMYNNKHWLSDVVAGAGFGILSTKLTYVVYPHLKKFIGPHMRSLSFAPLYQQHQVAYRFAYKF
ncbi:MAG: phosphatase PAP2 family protein [Pedobacter sp.]|nr:MAG: phosphatase PAP2 family protein [Pedobacter sp.]